MCSVTLEPIAVVCEQAIAGIRDTVDAALSYAVVFADFESGGWYRFVVVVVLVELVQHNGWLEWIAPLMMAAADVVTLETAVSVPSNLEHTAGWCELGQLVGWAVVHISSRHRGCCALECCCLLLTVWLGR